MGLERVYLGKYCRALPALIHCSPPLSVLLVLFLLLNQAGTGWKVTVEFCSSLAVFENVLKHLLYGCHSSSSRGRTEPTQLLKQLGTLLLLSFVLEADLTAPRPLVLNSSCLPLACIRE